MMLPLILTCSCPSSAAALPRRSPANWESCSAYCGLPADEGGTTTTAGLRQGMRNTGRGVPGAKGGEGGYIARRAGLTGAPHPCLGTAGLSIPGGDWSGLCPFSAFGLQRILAEGWPSRGQSQAAGRHLSLSPLFCTAFSPPHQRSRSSGSCAARIAFKTADRHRGSTLRQP